MKVKKPFIFNIIIGLIIASSISIATFSERGFLSRLELLSLDFLFRLRGPLSSNPHIIIIEIDDENIAKIGRWPWKRTWHAAMVKALKDLGAKYTYFDILFSENSIEEDDNLFSEAIKNAGNVYLPFVFLGRSTDYKNALLPIERLSSHIIGTGSMNIYPDIDGALRKITLFSKDKEGLHYHIALKIALDYLGLKIKEIKPNSLILANSKEEIEIPLIEGNRMLINWLGNWKDTFKHYSFLDILNAYQDILENKKLKIDVTALKDSICIVAVTATGLYDIKPVPLEPEYPGIGVTATTISNILDKKFIKIVPLWINLLLIYVLSLAPTLLIAEERPLREILSIFSVTAVFFIAGFLFKKGIRIGLAVPLLSLFTSYSAVATYNFARISIERKQFFNLAVTDELTGLFNIRYFNMILKAECLMARADPSKIFCIVMCDIDHFKHFNDTYGHQIGDLILGQVAKDLKISLRASDILARYGGEEMITIIRGALLKDGLNVAEKMRKNVENRLIKDGNNVYSVKISLGVAMFNPQNDNEDTVIKRADDALYKAKQAGRNRVETMEIS